MIQVRVLALILIALAACTATVAAQVAAPAEGGPLPKVVLSAPKDAAQVAYLGLGSKKEFTVADIPAEVVIVQIFNMY
jgi:hypothetical protein